jgi:2-keto-3-deoxy-L-rhamnonate aldolase RhmA
MRIVNHAKRKLLAGETSYGFQASYGNPIIVEAMAVSGNDFVLIDTQHGSWGPDSVTPAFIAARAGGAIPMARVTRNFFPMIGRLLDEGVLGIVIPQVDTPAQAKEAADACRLPPIGNRSWGWGRAFNYGSDYPQWIDEELFVAVQIESKDAIENAEAILSTPGVDGFWFGPADLQLSYGHRPFSPGGLEVLAKAEEAALTAARNTGKITGYAGASPQQARELSNRGFRFLTCGSDVGMINNGIAEGMKILRGE